MDAMIRRGRGSIRRRSNLSPTNLDWDTWLGTAPKKAFDPYAFARWRCWKEYGTGVAGDLMVHLISGMQFVMGINEAPKTASAIGGIYRWKDGRNMPDVHTVLFKYGEIPVYVRLSGMRHPRDNHLYGLEGDAGIPRIECEVYAAGGSG